MFFFLNCCSQLYFDFPLGRLYFSFIFCALFGIHTPLAPRKHPHHFALLFSTVPIAGSQLKQTRRSLFRIFRAVIKLKVNSYPITGL
jgi:hypothetical protein